MKKWRHALILLLIFVVGSIVGPMFVGMTGWSDSRSQWGIPFFIFLLSSGLAIATYWLYRRPGTIHKVQAFVLWLIFSAVAAIAGYHLWTCWLFIEKARALQ